MNSLNQIYVDQMVRALRQEVERERVRREQLANFESEGFVAKSRRFVGASVIGVGEVIQGRQKAEPQIELEAVSDLPLKLAQ